MARPSKRENVEIGEDDGIIAVERRFKREQAEAVERENRLDQQRAGEEGRDEGAGKAGDHDQHGVAEDVAIEHAPLGQALHPRGDDILLADFVDEGVLGQEGRGGEGAERQGRDRQHDVPEIILDLPEQAEAAAKSSEVRPRSGKICQNEPPANSTISRMANRKLGMA